MNLITVDEHGLYCRAGGFWIDPWRPVPRAVITHAHADHARPGSDAYLCSRPCAPFLAHRLGGSGAAVRLEPLDFGEPLELGDCRVSLHPAGHCAGSAQVRVERGGEVWVVTGDFKRDEDPSCEPFETVPCDTLITEATFAVPIYRWERGETTARRIVEWWEGERERSSLLFCYAFGKTQRVLAELARLPRARKLAEERGVFLHGAAGVLTDLYREQGYDLLPARLVKQAAKDELPGALVIAPPSAHRSVWMKRFRLPQTAFASGWMLVRGARRRRGYERGFVISDHADWPGLLRTIEECGAKRIFITHGRPDLLARTLTERGLKARPLETLFSEHPEGESEGGESEEAPGGKTGTEPEGESPEAPGSP